jgi:hypothetical protein
MNDYVTQVNTYMTMYCDNYLSITWDDDTLSWYHNDFEEEKEPDIMSPKKSLERMKFGMEE